MLIALINKSTLISNSDLEIATKALQIQFDLHVAPAFDQKSPAIKFYENVSEVPGYAWVVYMLDNSDQAGALGYHLESNDKIDGYIFAKPVLDAGGKVLFDTTNPQNVTVSSVLSHEVIEMFGDRFANLWADMPSGNEIAYELCDPVQGDSYQIDVNGTIVNVSNFVFPNYFNMQGTSQDNDPFDYLKKLSAPFTMTAGGYMIVRTTGTTSQVMGAELPKWVSDHSNSIWYRR
jgi:hypothetical protein